MGLALDAPQDQDVLIHDGDGVRIFASRTVARSLGAVQISWFGDERGGFLAAWPMGCGIRPD